MAIIRLNGEWSYTGNLPDAWYSTTTCSWNFTIDSTTRGNSFMDMVTLGPSFKTYRVGKLTFSFSGSTILTVRVIHVNDNDNPSTSGQIYSGHDWTTYVNYYDTSNSAVQNQFYVDVPSSGPGGGGKVTVTWEASTDRELVENTNYKINNPVYDGQSHYGLYQLNHCSAVQTARTYADTYQETIYADNGTSQFTNCYYFVNPSTGDAQPSRTISWTISKADQTWTLRPSSLTMLPSSTDEVVIDGNWAGTITADTSNHSIATISSINQNTGGIIIASTATTGNTTLTVKTAGNRNIEEHEVTATITVTSGDKPVRIYHNGAWVNAIPYIYATKLVDGQSVTKWWKATANIYSGGQWKETKA